ncbi:MAG TPA: hypothetical protein PKY12_14455 [Catalimonadaceae bacterium]|nr:hypothetical protein [Catalimonadaceae bacterium]
MEELIQNSKTFVEFLSTKNIDSENFMQKEPGRFEEWKKLFELVHEDSFVMQKKFYINPIRRKYPKINHFATN